jgi:hypothetical protein
MIKLIWLASMILVLIAGAMLFSLQRSHRIIAILLLILGWIGAITILFIIYGGPFYL